jgi:prevent-host-death family protein
MRTFALSELARNSGAVRHEAARAPVAITDRNRPRFVLMAIEDYEKLSRRAQDPRRVLDLVNLPAAEAEIVGEALDRLILDEDRV